jgi:hypothetical protein
MVEYAALSYCWGKTKSITTTEKTLQEHIDRGFDYEMLPQTILDAIRITQGMGPKYLWIDALCIVQGSFEDWRKKVLKWRAFIASQLPP